MDKNKVTRRAPSPPFSGDVSYGSRIPSMPCPRRLHHGIPFIRMNLGLLFANGSVMNNP